MSSPLEIEDWCTITGRGDVAVVDTRKFPEGLVVNVGDVVRFVGKDGHYKVSGIESSRYLTAPPRPCPSVGLQVRQLTDSEEKAEPLRSAIVEASYDYWYDQQSLGCDTRGNEPAAYVAAKLLEQFDLTPKPVGVTDSKEQT